MMLTADHLVSYLTQEFDLEMADLESSTLLFSSGLIDSYALVQLMTYIEEQCGFRISASDVTLDNLDSVERILAYVERATA